jgi:hypothetical protein
MRPKGSVRNVFSRSRLWIRPRRLPGPALVVLNLRPLEPKALAPRGLAKILVPITSCDYWDAEAWAKFLKLTTGPPGGALH